MSSSVSAGDRIRLSGRTGGASRPPRQTQGNHDGEHNGEPTDELRMAGGHGDSVADGGWGARKESAGPSTHEKEATVRDASLELEGDGRRVVSSAASAETSPRKNQVDSHQENTRAVSYFFLNRASKAARPGLTFSEEGGAAGPGLTMRRPVASRTVSGLKKSQVLAAVFEGKRFGIGCRHSKRAPGSKCTQFRQQWSAAPHLVQSASVGSLSRAGCWFPH